MALTGRFNFRRSWFGKLMLKVEDEVELIANMLRGAKLHREQPDAITRFASLGVSR